MKRNLFIALSFVTLLLCAAILSDAMPLLRGPAPETPLWYWPYLLRPVGRWWWALGAAGLMAGWISLWLRFRPKLSPYAALFLLAILHLMLQLGIVYADASRTWLPPHEAVTAELIDRTLPPLTSGYFWDATHIDDIVPVLYDFPAQMALFESEHTRTHPPGLLLLNWLTLRAFDNQPALTTPIANLTNTLRCTDLWLIDNSPNVPTALLAWALLPLIAASAAIPAAYYLAGALRFDPKARRLAAAMVATLPALLLFAPKVDQIFVPLALLSVASAVLIARAESNKLPQSLLLGVGLGMLVFLSIGNAGVGFVVGLLFLWAGFGRKTFLRLTMLAIGVAIPWLLFTFWFGPTPWSIISAGLEQHYDLVTTQRPYGVWVLWNLVDVLTYASPVLAVGFFATCWQARKTLRMGRIQAAFALSLLLLLVLLDLSGSARGEVGRIWVFLFALMAVAAAEWLAKHFSSAGSALLMLAVAVAIGLAWRPVRPVTVVASPPAMSVFQPQSEHRVALSPEITLVGSTLTSDNLLSASLLWEASGASHYPYTAFVHVLDQDGALVAQHDQWSLAGEWPPTCWRAGDTIYDDTYLIDISALAGGSYEVVAGMYNRQTLERIGETVLIGSVSR